MAFRCRQDEAFESQLQTSRHVTPQYHNTCHPREVGWTPTIGTASGVPKFWPQPLGSHLLLCLFPGSAACWLTCILSCAALCCLCCALLSTGYRFYQPKLEVSIVGVEGQEYGTGALLKVALGHVFWPQHHLVGLLTQRFWLRRSGVGPRICLSVHLIKLCVSDSCINHDWC